MKISIGRLSCVLSLAAFLMTAELAAQINLRVDATEASRRILHSHLTIPAKPGPMTLVYPKWIPGEHGPTGPIIDVAGLKISANGTPVPWQRDLQDMYSFHVAVPDGANALDVQFDMLGNADKSGFLLGYAATANLTGISWNQVVMYPAGVATDSVTFTASLKLPDGWKFATALPMQSQDNDGIQFATVNLTTLVDSPVLAGRYFREVDITPPDESRKHFLDLAADSTAALHVPPDWLEAYKNLVRETGALFGARHYNDYHFLVSLHGTDMNGLEHHQSSQDLLPEFGLVDPDVRAVHGYLLAHEMTHSWNGKFRRPVGLATANYQDPMKGDLLWVYEGLTHHLGFLLATRSGIWTPENYRDELAFVAQRLSYRSGRAWRPLEDTAAAAQLLYFAPNEWDSWRRDVDYYQEGSLIWLEADTIIRKQTNNARSLDDFCRAFYGGESGAPRLVPYNIDDIIAGLNAVAPYDWRDFFQTRIYDVAPKAPLAGITNSGWKIVYREGPTALGRAQENVRQVFDTTASLGLIIDMKPDNDGYVVDVIIDGPAAKAGIAPSFKIIAVNGRKYSPARLRIALREAKDSKEPIELLAANGDFFKTYKIDYHGGERYAHLERDTSQPDILTEIAKAKAR